MKTQTINHNLIENILTLLNLPEYHAKDTVSQGQINHVSALPSKPDPQNLQIAHEIIKFMDEMPGGFLIYRADDEEEIIYANKALLRIFQCSSLEEFQEFTGNSFKGIVHTEDLEAVEQSIWEQLSHNQYDLDYVEYRIVRKDGEIRWIEDYGHFVHTKSAGDIFYVFMVDATDKKEQLQQWRKSLLEEQEQKIQNLTEKYDGEHLRRLEVIEGLSINYESILYADLDSGKVFPYRLSSRTRQQFDDKYQILEFPWYISNYVITWVHPEDRELVAKMTAPRYIREKLKHSKTYYVNYRVLKNKKTQYLQLRIVNVGKKEHVSQIVLGYRRVDLEVRREMEQNQMLENALNNANLAIVARDTFLSNMSHDMRTPLNAIFGFTALAKKHIREPKTVLEDLNKIERSSRQLLELIDRVLALSWTESQDAALTECACNLRDIFEEVHRNLLPQAEEKNIAFSLNFTGLTHSDIWGDSEKLKQLLSYLTTNAITYTKANGRVELAVIEQKQLPNDTIVYQFQVKDNGIGIGKEFIKHIFEPFEREKNTTFSGIHGTGLSLTIAKNIAGMMGGNIEVDSTVGVGSTFTVTLRLRTQVEPVASPGKPEYTDFQKLNYRILLVEDNMINLEIETEILQDLGFSIDIAANGSIAVERVANSEPGEFDLILMDIQMPVMDGRQAARKIRSLKDPRLAHIPIIALSANAFESDKRLSLESGMNEHLTKPIDIPLLLETIRSILQKS
ncbi:ATP-binding protein [Lachnospiraceae bacterium 45-W7]